MYRLAGGIWFVFYMLTASGQEPGSFADFNNRTYALYEQRQWKDLLKTGREAIHNGYDYYYLRMRMGIAAYERKNYMRAIPHFRKALTFNRTDSVAQEYLYYCYLFSNRKIEAQALLDKMPGTLRSKVVKKETGSILSLMLSADYYYVNKNNTHPAPANFPSPSAESAWRNMENYGGETSVTAEWETGGNIRLQTGYRFLTKQRDSYVLENGQETYSPENVYNQHHFFTQFQIRLYNDTYLSLSAGFLNLRPRYAASTRWGQTILKVSPEYNYTGYLLVKHDFPYISFIAGGGISNLNGYLQTQQEAEVILYPLGNINLYFSAGLTNVVQQATDPVFRRSLFGTATLGVRVMKPLWIQVYESYGDRYNVQLQRGWEVYNLFNPLSEVFGAEALISIPAKKLVINAGFFRTAAKSYYFYQDQEILFRNEPIKYNLFNINGGLKWNF
ncbi:MAG: hypothetical protein GXO83_13740 [Chlorobi bacterium]|nr:hypothetical protein [Chlorobiota bacterium]